MRPYDDNYEDFDDFADFAAERSRARQKFLDAHRREERESHQNRHRDRFKGRRDHIDWNWNDDRDWDPDVKFYEDLTRRY